MCLVKVHAESYGNRAIAGFRIVENKNSIQAQKHAQQSPRSAAPQQMPPRNLPQAPAMMPQMPLQLNHGIFHFYLIFHFNSHSMFYFILYLFLISIYCFFNVSFYVIFNFIVCSILISFKSFAYSFFFILVMLHNLSCSDFFVH